MRFFLIILAAALSLAPNSRAQDLSDLGGDLTNDIPANFAITLPAPNISSDELYTFNLEGFVVFNHLFDQEKRNDKFILGPNFNHNACGSCHVGDGKGRVAISQTSPGSAMLVKVALRGLNDDGSPRNVPGVGEQLQDHTKRGGHRFNINLSWLPVRGSYPDGTRYKLRKPNLTFEIPGYTGKKAGRIVHSLRMTPPVFGMGLLEAVPDETIEAMADPDDLDQDGISGRVSLVPDRETNTIKIGRFGFRASNTTVKQQSAAAFFNDMGMTNELFTDETGSQEVSDEEMAKVVFYQQAVGVPKAKDQSDPDVIAGKELFQTVGCDDCHKMTLTTGVTSVVETNNQEFHPFTDLLLHDMGRGLSDKRAEFSASGREWRTTPLWALGFLEDLNRLDQRYLHDGRARTVEEAILWHGGEAKASRDAFKALELNQRLQLLRFLRSI